MAPSDITNNRYAVLHFAEPGDHPAAERPRPPNQVFVLVRTNRGNTGGTAERQLCRTVSRSSITVPASRAWLIHRSLTV
jgi:hypothetical protein